MTVSCIFYNLQQSDSHGFFIFLFPANPRVVFAVIGVVVGLLLLLFVIGTTAYFIKHRTILPLPAEPTSSGFENAMYCKDEDNVNITEI